MLITTSVMMWGLCDEINITIGEPLKILFMEFDICKIQGLVFGLIGFSLAIGKKQLHFNFFKSVYLHFQLVISISIQILKLIYLRFKALMSR